jgi:hypothetical protein
MFCGTGDKLAQPEDYLWLRDQLVNAEIVHFKEYDAGHLWFLIPAWKQEYFSSMFNLISKINPHYDPKH